MEIRRVYCPECAAQQRVLLTGESASYALRVLRCRRGDRLTLFCADGKDYDYEVVDCARGTLELERRAVVAVGADPQTPLVLLQGFLKAGLMDEVLRAATALGITVFLPFVAQRSIGRPTDAHQARWERVAISAAQQCGRTTLPELAAPAASLAGALAHEAATGAALRVCFWEGAAERGAEVMHTGEGGAALVVGPEGGLAREELAAAEAAGWAIRGLGPRILRAELAAVVALARLVPKPRQAEDGA